MKRILSLSGVLTLGFASLASAQQAPTTVQLPTFSFFTVSTSVSVPDSGGSYLGGLMRGRDSSSTRGLSPFPLLANRSMSSERDAGGMSVRAWIHDFRRMDEAVLADAVARRESDPASLKGAALSSSLEKSSPGNEKGQPSLLSLADIRRQNELQDAAQIEEAKALFAKAEEYAAAGKLGLAKLNYKRAAARSGELKEQAAERIRLLAAKRQATMK